MSGKLVHLTTYYSSIEARICISFLNAYGIYVCAPHFIASNFTHRLLAFGGFPILVVDADYEAAKELLNDLYEDIAAQEAAEPTVQPSRLEIISNFVLYSALCWFFSIPPAPVPPRTPGKRKL